MKKVTISTATLKEMNKSLVKDNLKICSETHMILPLEDKYWGKRGDIYQAYCRFAR